MSPIIIIGMHRSGTSLLTRTIEQLGVYFGYAKDGNNESLFFQNINEWLLRQANATWDNPYCFDFVSDELTTTLSRALSYFLKGEHRNNYLGPEHSNRFNNIADIDFPWGWKDPRNTYTIRIWRKLFPDARIIHIYRHPIDVAYSLHRREIELNKRIQSHINQKGIENLIAGGTKLCNSPRMESIDEGIKLWSEYVTSAHEYCEGNAKNCLQLKYESLLQNPIDNLSNIADFLDLDSTEEDIKQCSRSFVSSRCFAFSKDEKLLKYFESIKDDQMVIKLGYDQLQT